MVQKLQMHKTNPRWQTAAMLKIRKWPYFHNGLTDWHEIWHGDARCPSELDQPLNFFELLEIQAGGRPPS